MYFDSRDVAANSIPWYQSVDTKKMTITIELGDEDVIENLQQDLSEEAFKLIDESGCVTFPMKYEVCPLCEGKGSHVNPSIDAHGITADEWDRDWSYEDREMYMNGFYNVTCYKCGGKNVVPTVNESYLDDAEKEILKVVEDDRAEEASYRQMCMMERAMGA